MENLSSAAVLIGALRVKIKGFLVESHLCAFHTLRIVYSMEEPPITYFITFFVANDASFGTFALSEVIQFGLPMDQYFQQITFDYVNHLWKQFHVFKT